MRYKFQNPNNTRLFSDLFFNNPRPNRQPVRPRRNTTFNVIEDDEGYTIELVAPGLSKEDLNIKIDKNQLNVSVKRKDEKQEGERKVIRQDFITTQFKKSFTMPNTVDLDKIEGAYETGILKLSLPLKKEIIRNMSRDISVN